jgi:hypothetical protein
MTDRNHNPAYRHRAAPITARTCEEAHDASIVVMQPHRTVRPLITTATSGSTGPVASRQGGKWTETQRKQVLRARPTGSGSLPTAMAMAQIGEQWRGTGAQIDHRLFQPVLCVVHILANQ